ncbi:MAG: neutral/alkaline non-lysosomal ceramidase N-terminal domain-containing protein [Anaerolineae bacterium]|nr:neutral/alkaline non-lysosomal ceramidase N-terminal domain-containing protein [Anaerolineae bacterium]
MLAGTATIDITPTGSVWMDGMLRAHPSAGVHDPLYAHALVLTSTEDLTRAFAIVSVDVCALDARDTDAARQATAARIGIPAAQIVIAATHTHSGPAAVGLFGRREEDYARDLVTRLVVVIERASRNLQPVAVGWGAGREETISHYRRLLADDGHVVMNWEPYPTEHIVGPLGVIDPEVGVLKVVTAKNPQEIVALLFNHAGHPNILSGDNLLLSAEYPGLAERLLEAKFGGTALFVNGAQGTVDIDGLRDRDWVGMERAANALAHAVAETAGEIAPSGAARLCGASARYVIPSRKITDHEWAWAQAILEKTGGVFQAMPDGVGDDFKAAFYRQLRQAEGRDLPVEQICLAVGDCAFISFPGELYTEIGQHIKAKSPFERTYVIGLANGYIGYVPTRKAIGENSYAEDIRLVDEAAEDIVVAQSLALLHHVHTCSRKE